MSKYQSFVFESYAFNESAKSLYLHYSMDGSLHFTEKYLFDFNFADYDPDTLDRAVQILFFIAGVSYYKTYVPKNISLKQGIIDKQLAQFLSNTYQKGLGEFWYVNDLDPKTPVNFPINGHLPPLKNTHSNGALVAVGGGKDSLVSIECLSKTNLDIATWSLNHREQLEPLARKTGHHHYFIEREWDPQLKAIQSDLESYNGHVPISAIFAAVGTVLAVLTGKKDIVMSNESSADEPTLQYKGVPINHQYSKSSEFECDFQSLLQNNFGESVRYYSLLRSMNEIQIAKLFVMAGTFDRYKDTFCSCNRAFVHTSSKMTWDGTCAKCAFVYLILAPFCTEEDLTSVFGRNVLLAEDMKPTYDELLSITKNKPLECVGTINESRWAMDQMKSTYPILKDRYEYEGADEKSAWAKGLTFVPDDIRMQLIDVLQ